MLTVSFHLFHNCELHLSQRETIVDWEFAALDCVLRLRYLGHSSFYFARERPLYNLNPKDCFLPIGAVLGVQCKGFHTFTSLQLSVDDTNKYYHDRVYASLPYCPIHVRLLTVPVAFRSYARSPSRGIAITRI